MNRITGIIVIVVIVLAAAAGRHFLDKPDGSPVDSPDIPAELQPRAERAIGIAASIFHVKPEEIVVLSILPVAWANSSLGGARRSDASSGRDARVSDDGGDQRQDALCSHE